MIRTVAFFLYEDFQLLDAAGPIAVFEIASRFVAGGAYRIVLAAKEKGRVRASSGVELPVEALCEIETIDTLIVVGGEGARTAMACNETLDAVRDADRRARRLCSVCSGAFILAAAGLLDGLSVTTHWRAAPAFARQFPQVQTRADRIYIRQGRVWTSAGVSAGVDLALALAAEDLGEEIAKRVAQEMVVYYRRPGGQSQFSTLLELDSPDHRFASLLEKVRGRLDRRWTVEKLAEEACMSPRHFSRAFAAATGLSPAKAIERLRLEVARERVEAGVEPIEIIADRVGFGDPERMRRAFVQTFGVPPQGLRRQARGISS
ncbi:GlxA family transcriptional regulator [Methylocystis sp. Sn-Cys]|uniref:GlxA family transcriptional regulator n=1 Tax=Methylocystis sp. Sn-Cys TaxID=1701263 RepID=UPI001920FD5A|nr:DJ-1/PfpI family protein [Methylocystis sp. Sn-Cys]MBL1255422.1 DJ-1/PfpI family protein [Methylocystis sp. Sn-Cys]